VASKAKYPPPGKIDSEHDLAILRLLPPVDECIAALEREGCDLSRAYLKRLVRRAQSVLRQRMVKNPGLFANRQAITAWILNRVREAARSGSAVPRPVINGTGIILHTNLGRAPIAEPAIEAMVTAARSAVNLEYDLATGRRGERDILIEEALTALTGAEAAAVVNNNAAAVLLVLAALAAGREVIVSRGELIEIGGSFRIPEILAQSGARMREVGTTNRTHLHDYADAINPETALLLKVHPSNYRVMGFTHEVTIEELAELGRERGIDTVEDLGSGAMIDLARYGLEREPVVARSIAAGAALVTFSGDKLLGGPQAGLIAGRRALIDRIRAHPLRRALRCDKLTLAALGATLDLYLRAPNPLQVVPALRMISRTIEEIDAMAPAARTIVASMLGEAFTVEIIPSMAEAGSGASPVDPLPSRALRVTHPRLQADEVASRFRRAVPPVIGRIVDGAFAIDLRAIEDPRSLAVRMPDDPIQVMEENNQ
jgi:L-seryl-tRNA(Ser) seleniumtransferase